MSSISSTSSLLASQKISSAISPMTTMFSTTDEWSAWLAANTISTPESWEIFEADVWDPYIPVILGDLGDGYPPTDSAYVATHESCSLAWDASFYHWIATEEAMGYLKTVTESHCNPAETLDNGRVFSSTCYTDTGVPLTSLGRFNFVAKPPCCGACTFTAGDVQVYQWPLATEVPFMTKLVNTNEFTFTYPSVYVSFQTVHAWDKCGALGTSLNNFTMGFKPTELLTGVSYRWTGYIAASEEPDLAQHVTKQSWWSFTALNTEQIVTCTDIVTTLWMNPEWAGIYYICTSSYTPEPDEWGTPTSYLVTYNPCTPYLSIPARILTLDALWSTCRRDINGLHDPPIILTTANGFFPPTTTAYSPPDPTKTGFASAAQGIQLPSATKTPAPGSQSPGTDPVPASRNDPTIGDPHPRASKLPAVFTRETERDTANSAGEIVYHSHTFAPGEKFTDSDTVFSMADDGRKVIINETSTQCLDPSYAIGTQIFSAGGPAITVSGTIMSVASDGEIIVIGESPTTTEDISVLLAAPTSTGQRGNSRSSVDSRAGKGVKSNSALGKCCKHWMRWQIVLSIVLGATAFA